MVTLRREFKKDLVEKVVNVLNATEEKTSSVAV